MGCVSSRPALLCLGGRASDLGRTLSSIANSRLVPSASQGLPLERYEYVWHHFGRKSIGAKARAQRACDSSLAPCLVFSYSQLLPDHSYLLTAASALRVGAAAGVRQ